jgi:hypothetical protein
VNTFVRISGGLGMRRDVVEGAIALVRIGRGWRAIRSEWKALGGSE